MLPTDICRTCALQAENLLSLSTRNEKYADKSFSEMLHELTQSDPLMEHLDDSLPQFVCVECLQLLENAYGFVLQARLVQEQLLHRINKGLECLDETPIDIAMQRIKTETDMAKEASDDEAATVSVGALKLQPESETDSSQAAADAVENDVLELMPNQLRRSCRNLKVSTDSESENSNATPLKRRRGRPARVPKRETLNKDGRHVCEVCGKTFSWHRDMQRHARVHFEQADYVCEMCGKEFLRKDKYMHHLRSHEKRQAKRESLQLGKEWSFAERLYSSECLKSIECKLCGLKCQRIQELRQHLFIHLDIGTLSNLSSQSEVILEHFDSQLDLLQIKQQICADLAKGSDYLDKYCAVINAHGYELCLDDSDEESAESPAYHCLPCNLDFSRKHLLMQHTLQQHTQSKNEMINCNHCQIGFVCSKLLAQHQRTQCHNQLKRHACHKCPGKFIWQQNLRKHECSDNTRTPEDRESSKFLCCLCDEQLPSMTALRAHLLSHSDGQSGIDSNGTASFFRCYYPEGITFEQVEISKRIASDFAAQDYGRYFNACTGSGQELDFLDSDADLSVEDAPAAHCCDLCGHNTTHLAQLLKHQQKEHSEQLDALPHVCETCGVGFVAAALLQQHRRRSCGKRHAKYQCEQCKLRFIWQSNYDRHLEQHREREAKELPNTRLRNRKQAASLQCSECEKVFIWPKDLTRHKRLHQPESLAQFQCTHCERKFHRKDGLKSHLRVHGEQQLETNETTAAVAPFVWSQLGQPHGCKRIQCMICLSLHSKISDLRTHLLNHQFLVEFPEERDIASTSQQLYPELENTLNKQQLIERIQLDVSTGIELERFVCITNEASIELSLDSSETDTDLDEDTDKDTKVNPPYSCELCQLKLQRKHQLYYHQLEQHSWQQSKRTCCHCQARFISEQLLAHHQRTLCGNPHKRFLCRKCPFRFRWRDNLKQHMDVAHQEATEEQTKLGILKLNVGSVPTVPRHDCLECNRSFKMQKDLTRHTLMHAKDSSIYRCCWCARRFYRQANLLQHIERHGITASQLPYAESLLNSSRHPNGQKCIQCKVCDLSFPSIAALRSHLSSTPDGTHHAIESMLNYSITNQLGYELHLDDSETDEEQKPAGTPSHYTCSMCQLRCVRKYELHQHQQAMHRLERITEGCDQCIFKSVSVDLITHHQRMQCSNEEKQFKCVHCGFRFMWESNLLLHIQLQHPSSNDQQKESSVNPETSSLESQIFQCGQCTRKYNRKDRLTAHVKKCHAPGAVAKIATPPTAAKQQKSFLCAFCGKAVSSSSNLIIHIRRHTGEKPFKCDYCDMAFPRSSDLQCHRRTHTGERPHVCTVCQKGFARSYKLQQHMRIHNGERPYKCTYCDKSFTQSNDLTLHIRRHTGERPYQCETCGERFIQGTALKHHRLQSGHYEAGEALTKDN